MYWFCRVQLLPFSTVWWAFVSKVIQASWHWPWQNYKKQNLFTYWWAAVKHFSEHKATFPQQSASLSSCSIPSISRGMITTVAAFKVKSTAVSIPEFCFSPQWYGSIISVNPLVRTSFNKQKKSDVLLYLISNILHIVFVSLLLVSPSVIVLLQWSISPVSLWKQMCIVYIHDTGFCIFSSLIWKKSLLHRNLSFISLVAWKANLLLVRCSSTLVKTIWCSSELFHFIFVCAFPQMSVPS